MKERNGLSITWSGDLMCHTHTRTKYSYRHADFPVTPLHLPFLNACVFTLNLFLAGAGSRCREPEADWWALQDRRWGLERASWECNLQISQSSAHCVRRKSVCMGLGGFDITLGSPHIHVQHKQVTSWNKNVGILGNRKVIKIHWPNVDLHVQYTELNMTPWR